MVEENFTAFYKHVKEKKAHSKDFRMLHISMLRLYLLAIGREDVAKISYPIKLHVRTFFEVLMGISHLVWVILSTLFGKKAQALILIIEPTHLKQMLGMETYLKEYHPIFLTTKRNYIPVLKTTFKTTRVVYIPSFFINPSWVKPETMSTLYHQHQIKVTPEIIAYSAQAANEQINHYRYIKLMLAILGKFHQFKIALVFNDLTITGRIISLLLQETGCKTCYVMHGLLSDEFIESIHIADEFFIFGEYTRPILVKRGLNTNHIHTIGAPYLDYYRHHQPMDKLKDVVLNKHTKNKSIALVLLSGRGHTTSSIHHDKIINLLNEVIEECKDQYYFVFKLHKKDYIDFYQLLYKNKNIENNFAIYPFDCFNSSESIFDWLSISDLIITGASTTALEAMYLKKPVITVDLMAEYENETQYIQQNGTYHCRTKNELLTNLHHLKLNQFTPKSEANDIALAYFSDGVTMHKFFFNQFTAIIS